MLYDVFICHASEDKDSFVRPLAEALKKRFIEVWYDEFSLVVGDSLRESIDKGLAKSRYGIVVLSPAFFNKKWPIRELNGLVAREMSEDDPIILPIWHNITAGEILEYSPPLADRKAVNSKNDLDFVCNELIRKIHPDNSPLLIARDKLINHGLNPPVVTDEWWLNVIEMSNKIPSWGIAIPEDSCWGRWAFPLPNDKSSPENWGEKLAWTAMQIKWEEEAKQHPITQISHPNLVLNYINSFPGLKELCFEYPHFLATYAPQLTIKGFGGDFENIFDILLDESILKYFIKENNSTSGDRSIKPLCDVWIALRHHLFGNYDSSTIACNFVQGDSLFGPTIKYFDIFDYAIWLLSNDSSWLPRNIHDFLIDGMKSWGVWITPPDEFKYKFDSYFIKSITSVKNMKEFDFNYKTKESLLNWIAHSITILGIEDEPDVLLDKFIKNGFIERYFLKKEERRKKRKS